MKNPNAPKSQPFRPAQHTEQQLITAILDGTYPPGSSLPAERMLAEQFGVTRPTIREALQRLANEGWISIRHGKATEVNDFWQTGGLRLLGTLVKYGEHLPESLILHLLDFRIIMLPPVAVYAVQHAPEKIREHLAGRHNLLQTAEAYTDFDWEFQLLLAKRAGNPIFPLILNDFKSVFTTMGRFYFSHATGRKASANYYEAFAAALDHPERIEQVVRDAMSASIAIWKQINPAIINPETKEKTDATMERMGR